MSNPTHQPRNKWMIAVSLTLCALLAVVGEMGQFHFIYGISFSLTSLFVLLSVRLFGIGGGLLTAFAAFLASAAAADHLMFQAIGLLEAFVVGLMMLRYRGRLFMTDLCFWLFVGMPLTYFFYNQHYSNTGVDIKLIACLIAINGLFNALFAEILHQYLPLSRWSGLSSIKRLPRSMSQLLLHLSLGIVLVSFLLNMLVNSINSFKEVTYYVEDIAQQATNTITKEWGASNVPYTIPMDDVSTRTLQFLIDRYTTDTYAFSLIDDQHRVVASNHHGLIGTHLDAFGEKNYRPISEYLYFSSNYNSFSQLKLHTWNDEQFLYQSKLGNGTGHIIITFPLEYYQNYLFSKYFIHIFYLIGFALVAAFVSLLINRSFTRSLQRLAVATTNLPLKLKHNNSLELPKSNTVEIHSLIMNIKHMSSSLLYLFRETQSNNERLEMQAQLLQESEERLHQLAYYDMLTGLPNRHQFTRHFQELIVMNTGTAQHLKIGVLFADINRFKQINDTLGHAFGDKLLQLVAQRFQSIACKSCDVFRFGGDEFVFLVRYREEELSSYAEPILKCFIEPFLIDGMPLFLTVSIGISSHPQDGEDMDTIVRNADIAMYNAKEEGDGCYRFFKPNLLPLIEEKMRLENGLYKALQENQFSLYYQPKINAATGELCGIEALIRWKHPDLGLVPPDKFIPLAEESGFILEIDRWVFREACRQNKVWQDAGLKQISVSVNISARHFYQGNLKEMILSELKATGLDPHYVSLEITEGVFMRNIDQVIDTILYLRNLGIQISIDDFGTGYSSLNQLQRLPISDVKLDRSFIQGITSDDKKSSIVRAIIELVHSMNMKVVAEGVETLDESRFCKELKCDELQGYLFSRPLPADELEVMLAQADPER
ncbi:EAL domain-containing protein [Paenibacillus paeoniae]|uniref:EAL domain-containing protein n=1 Tax=Paenibacillus paeoniae TaxID=2292705 RepID=A0A371P8D5_9BACL|nr:EAL domain-containing protein [Paenibacillus paeoniae]REK71746.1 EAL domain-containing protein [Paenibacillus paeoniae]